MVSISNILMMYHKIVVTINVLDLLCSTTSSITYMLMLMYSLAVIFVKVVCSWKYQIKVKNKDNFPLAHIWINSPFT